MVPSQQRFRWALAISAALNACACASAAAATSAAATDPLALSAEPENERKTASAADDGRFFVEAAAGHATRRAGLGSREIGRLTLDGRATRRILPELTATASARLDATRPSDMRLGNPVLTLREAFVGWQGGEGRLAAEVGRVNLREGSAYGYNPTDWFKGQALRTITTANPGTLRESRLGTVMLRAQLLGEQSSLAVVVAPKLADRPSTAGWSADLGATNSVLRSQFAWSRKWSDGVNTQLTLFDPGRGSARVGVSGSALLSDAIVSHFEWAGGRAPTLLDEALGKESPSAWRNRIAAGLTYTTASKLSFTAEVHANTAALDRTQWRNLRFAAPALLGAYQAHAVAQQDAAARRAFFFYVTQRDLGWRNLELTALAKFNRSDASRIYWLELRQRFDNWDLSLQAQDTAGGDGSEFGVIPLRRSVGVVGTLYF